MFGTSGVVTIEPLRRRHLRSVRSIDRQVYPSPWSTALYLDELRQSATRVYRIARFGPRLVGYAGAMLVHDEGHVTSVAVDPRAQGGGVASRLMVALHRGMIDLGAAAMTLEVRVGNARARDLYRRMGYRPVGVRHGYYQDPDGSVEDALVMWCHDITEAEHGARLDGIASVYGKATEWMAS